MRLSSPALPKAVLSPNTNSRYDTPSSSNFVRGCYITQIILEPSSYTKEKFALYQIYQKEIHKEEKEKLSQGFKRFLVETPLHVRLPLSNTARQFDTSCPCRDKIFHPPLLLQNTATHTHPPTAPFPL